jgi:hypothetical protein
VQGLRRVEVEAEARQVGAERERREVALGHADDAEEAQEAQTLGGGGS